MNPIRVSLYDDNAAFRASMSTLISFAQDFHYMGAYADARQVIENCTYQLPHVILMDVEMPDLSGHEAVLLVCHHFPQVKVLMLTTFEDNENIFKAICNGAVGYILKKAEPALILNAIRDAFSGGAPMTGSIAMKVLQMVRINNDTKTMQPDISLREKEILTLMTKGHSYKMIAAECDVSIDTVRFHIKNIYEKIQVHSMTEAVSKALKNKWV